MKNETSESFGQRLGRIRKARALTQIELGKRVGISNRMIAYYEREDAEPPGGQLLPKLAEILRVSANELLGIKPLKLKADPKTTRLINRLKKVEHLSPADQRAVLKYIDALADRRARGNGK